MNNNEPNLLNDFTAINENLVTSLILNNSDIVKEDRDATQTAGNEDDENDESDEDGTDDIALFPSTRDLGYCCSSSSAILCSFRFA